MKLFHKNLVLLCLEYIYLGCDYQADVDWRIYNTNKPTDIGESQKLLKRRREVTGFVRCMSNFGCESELEFLSND